MAQRRKFDRPQKVERNPKERRIDAFSPKLNRSLTLYGEDSAALWTLIEIDSKVTSFCERPLVINSASPTRIVDFWVQYEDRQEFQIIDRIDAAGERVELPPAFIASAKTENIVIKYIDCHALLKRHVYLENCGNLIRYVSQYARYISDTHLERVLEICSEKRSVLDIQSLLLDIEQDEVRASVFILLYKGFLQCTSLAEHPFSSQMEVERT